MSPFRKDGSLHVFKVTAQVIDVAIVKEEYDFIYSHLSEAGGQLEIIARKTITDKKQFAYDRFTQMCADSGIYYELTFKVKLP